MKDLKISYNKGKEIDSLNVDYNEYHYSKCSKDKKLIKEIYTAFTSLNTIIQLNEK